MNKKQADRVQHKRRQKSLSLLILDQRQILSSRGMALAAITILGGITCMCLSQSDGGTKTVASTVSPLTFKK